MVRRLLMSFIIFGLTRGQNEDWTCIVTIPAELHHPSTETMCVYLRSPTSATQLTATLRTQTVSTVLTSRTYQGEGQQLCDTFQVPSPSGEEEVVTCEVSIGEQVVESKQFLITSSKTGIIMQTDKPIYKPEETVKARIVRIDDNLFSSNKRFDLIELLDPRGNLIGQWKHVLPVRGFVDLSHPLPKEPPMGDYKFIVRDKDTAEATFSVAQYVLPKHECSLEAPNTLAIDEDHFTVTDCCKYTYGKPVRGQAYGKICRRAIGENTDICKSVNGEMDVNGCLSVQSDSDFFKLKSTGYENFIDVEITLKEEGTGVEIKKEARISISTVIYKVEFVNAHPIYRTGLLYEGEMILTKSNGSPMPNEDLILYVNGQRINENFRTDSSGVAKFSLDTSAWNNIYVDLRGQYIPSQPISSTELQPVNQEAYFSVGPFYTAGKSQLKVRRGPPSVSCDEKVDVYVDYYIDPSEIPADRNYLDIHWQVYANGQINQNSAFRHTADKEFKGSASFTFAVTANLVPVATIFVYVVLPNGGLVADSADFTVTTCYPNKVALQFSEEETLPGSEVSLHISAAPNTNCSVRIMDTSVLLLRPDARDAEDYVKSFLSLLTPHGYPTKVNENQGCFFQPFQPVLLNDRDIARRAILAPSWNPQMKDTFSLLQGAGMKVFTNWNIRQSYACPFFSKEFAFAQPAFNMEAAPQPMDESIVMPDAPSEVQPPPPSTPIRKNFYENWLFDLMEISCSGKLEKKLKAPDSITKWVADVVCLSDIGLGISPKAYLTTFKPFFIEATLPPTMKRGETLTIKGTVYNYMKQCIKVQSTLFQSSDFVLEPCEGCVYSACLCTEPTYTFIWRITPTKIGFIEIIINTVALDTEDLCDGQKPVLPERGHSDAILKRLKVEPEGMRVEKVHSSFLCAGDTDKFSLHVPADYIKESEMAQLTVSGDVMGNLLSNLAALFGKPSGCGEQNMYYFVKNIYGREYLVVTNQITAEISITSKINIEKGYQGELNYKRFDGSFSAFGNSDDSGHTWLTAFVIQSFNEAKSTIAIDNKHIADAVAWLKALQQDNGCFKSVGKLFHTDLQGGQDGEVALTAYIFTILKELKDSQYADILEKAKLCLKRCLEPDSSLYSKALCFYAETMSDNTGNRETLKRQLDEVATKTGKFTHWSQNPVSQAVENVWSNPQSADVEVTAYVMLGYVSGTNPSSEELAYAADIHHWLTAQQKPNGEFCSTQDTVVALKAFSKYGRLTYAPGSTPIVTISNNKGFSGNLIVTEDKRLLVQTLDLPDIPEDYTVSITGSGCAAVQIVLRYNIPQPKPEGTFSLSVETSPIKCSPRSVSTFILTIKVSFISSRKVSNMAIVEVAFLSGYKAKRETVDNLLTNPVVKRVEVGETSVVIYLEEIGEKELTLSFEMEEECIVSNRKPGTVTVSDYYSTNDHVSASYIAHCL
ncbi:alpha-2-macroglobulin-like protein 1 [Discoglossus pictus]